jgi:hypothetical protein
MMGKMCGFIAYVKAIAPKCTNFHCIIIPYSLDVERITNALKRVLDEAVKIVNFIKSRPLHSNIQCLTEWVALTQRYSCTLKFDGNQESKFGSSVRFQVILAASTMNVRTFLGYSGM